jgi:hypothetical protein
MQGQPILIDQPHHLFDFLVLKLAIFVVIAG